MERPGGLPEGPETHFQDWTQQDGWDVMLMEQGVRSEEVRSPMSPACLTWGEESPQHSHY